MSSDPGVVQTLLSPLAAFLAPEELCHIAARYAAGRTVPDMASLGPGRSAGGRTDITWRIDGVESDGGRIFALPSFAIDKPPRRIDVYVTGQNAYMQKRSEAFLSCVVQALQQWSTTVEDFESRYMEAPFGSSILIQNFDTDFRLADVELVRTYDTEHEWLSMSDLQSFWHFRDEQWPGCIDLDMLQLQRQPHEAVSLVTIEGHDSEIFVFKSLLFELKYLYHEIKMLLTIDEHDNIMPRPKYLVSQRAKFGGRSGLCGMILEYYPMGTLRDALSRDSNQETVAVSDKYSWSLDVTSALQHMHKSSMGYFSGLKPSNILLKEDAGMVRPLLFDFEQRTGRSPWTPPEVYYVSLIEQVASSNVDPQVVNRYKALMRKYQSTWTATMRRRPRPYDGKDEHSRGPWSSFSIRERESAQVFMLGRLLWCLFEDVGSLSSGLDVEGWEERDNVKLFPRFEKTPLAMRECIRRCTIDAAEWRGNHSKLTIVNAKLHERIGLEVGHQLSFALKGSLETVREWWVQELETAEEFVQAHLRRRDTRVLDSKDSEVLGLIDQRPSLEEVRSMILKAQALSQEDLSVT